MLGRLEPHVITECAMAVASAASVGNVEGVRRMLGWMGRMTAEDRAAVCSQSAAWLTRFVGAIDPEAAKRSLDTIKAAGP